MAGLEDIIAGAAELDAQAVEEPVEAAEDADQEDADTVEANSDDATEQGAAEEAQEADAEENGEEPVKEAAPYRKVIKVNGQERVFNSEEELIKEAQLGASATAKFREASALVKQAQDQQEQINTVLELLQTNPQAILPQIMGAERFNQFARHSAEEAVKLEAMDPKDRKIYELELAQKAAEEQRKLFEQKEREQKAKIQRDQDFEQFQQMVTETLTNEGVNENNAIKQRFLLNLRAVEANQDLNSLNPYQLAALARQSKQEYIDDMKNALATFDPQTRSYILGEEQVKAAIEPEPTKAEVVKPSSKKEKPKMQFADDFWGDILEGNV